MMVRCEQGHFYDGDIYRSCPHCEGISEYSGNTGNMTVGLGEFEPTAPVTEQHVTEDIITSIDKVKFNDEEEDQDKTVGVYKKQIGMEPVVGWLVCTKGEYFGQDFKLKSGRNFIGRGANMDISLKNEKTVSRDRHAIVLYEPKNNIFIAQPGDSKELFYVNGKVVLAAQEIKAYDEITVGEASLILIPCCNEKFNWGQAKVNED